MLSYNEACEYVERALAELDVVDLLYGFLSFLSCYGVHGHQHLKSDLVGCSVVLDLLCEQNFV